MLAEKLPPEYVWYDSGCRFSSNVRPECPHEVTYDYEEARRILELTVEAAVEKSARNPRVRLIPMSMERTNERIARLEETVAKLAGRDEG